MLAHIARRETKDALILFNRLYAEGKDLAALLDELICLCRDLLILRTAPNAGLSMLSGVADEKEAQELARVIRDWGEEQWAARIAGIMCEQREKKPLTTTLDLVHAVDAAIPKAVRRKQDGHPARRTFQAIRIAVNDELAPLERAVRDFTDLLNPGGRICVITFHSLEDRIIKRCFKSLENPCICPPKAPVCTCGRKPVVRVLGGGAVAPTDEEIARNPRARSAKLRIAEKRAQG
jgi:16S rRNA (cytosine1402-N4)-methyltransferase